MRLCFLGGTHAAHHLAKAAWSKGFDIIDAPEHAELVFVSIDTPTDEVGNRDLDAVRQLAESVRDVSVPVVLTSAVPPGFTRSLWMDIWHQAETLRMKDAEFRAANPEMLIVGSDTGFEDLPTAYRAYLGAFRCEILRMTWEEAEFAKIAINACLASQVETTNRLAASAVKVGASWERIANVLKHDRRIGPHAYLEPGRWQNSRHLLRDMRTLESL